MRKKELDLNSIGGSYWFKRLVRDCKKISPYIVFKKLKYGFYRIYWVGAGESMYIAECYKEMNELGYEWYDIDPRLESRKYYEEFEDQIEYTRKIKNFVEGYWENLSKIQKRIYNIKHNKEAYKQAVQGYKQMRVK